MQNQHRPKLAKFAGPYLGAVNKTFINETFLVEYIRAPRPPTFPTFPTKQVGISYFEENSPTFPTFFQLTKMFS